MKVRNLISDLQRFDPELTVAIKCVSDIDGEVWFEEPGAREVLLRPRYGSHAYLALGQFEEAREASDQTRPGVVLE